MGVDFDFSHIEIQKKLKFIEGGDKKNFLALNTEKRILLHVG